MTLVDDVKIIVKAGNGGNGSNVFTTIPGSPKSFADGGNGGRGGNIYVQVSNNVSDLSQFRFKKKIRAEDGENGMSKNMTGKSGEDTVILLPKGTKVINEETHEVLELIDQQESILIARGGYGGEGNHDFKPDINTLRVRRKEGVTGEEKKLHLVLSLIADIGFIGYPNAGKSSLLDVLTNAKPKIGNYPFTTVEPNLGALGTIILADIPGLIEGASRGKGLGITFLKHIEKTKVLLHCIDATSDDPLDAYQTLRDEFKQYSESLLKKEEVILLTKMDLLDKERLQQQTDALKKLNKTILPVSVYQEESIQQLKTLLTQLAEKYK